MGFGFIENIYDAAYHSADLPEGQRAVYAGIQARHFIDYNSYSLLFESGNVLSNGSDIYFTSDFFNSTDAFRNLGLNFDNPPAGFLPAVEFQPPRDALDPNAYNIQQLIDMKKIAGIVGAAGFAGDAFDIFVRAANAAEYYEKGDVVNQWREYIGYAGSLAGMGIGAGIFSGAGAGSHAAGGICWR
jgi:hypothetical protein